MYKGIGISDGIAINKAFVLSVTQYNSQDLQYSPSDSKTEWKKLQQSLEMSRREIKQIQEQNKYLSSDEMWIFDAHLTILDDPLILNELNLLIDQKKKSALQAVREVISHFEQMFEKMEDEYMRERAQDLRDIGNRLTRNILGQKTEDLPMDEPFILFAHEISPSLMAQLDPQRVHAIVTTHGNHTSHVSIIARALGIPYVVRVDEQLERTIRSGDWLAVDGNRGVVAHNPDEEERQQFAFLLEQFHAYKEKLSHLKNVSANTEDGYSLELLANISAMYELDVAVVQNAGGVGLYRSEYLFMEQLTAPSEEEQFAVYRQLLAAFPEKPVVIRTIDIGGDKHAPCLPLPKEENPFLGLRAIRFSLQHPAILGIQLRAILRASAYGNIKILMPMVTSMDEVIAFKRMLEEARRELRTRNVVFNDNIPLGAMIEVPAAAFIMAEMAAEVDFFSIGTNDLAQYMLAADRMNEHVAHVYEPYHPAMIRLLTLVCRTAAEYGKPISVCGELASDLLAVPLWIALGVHELSMSASHLLQVKERVLKLRAIDCKLIHEKMLVCRSSGEIREVLAQAKKVLIDRQS
jgi:phosphotransferase system enzyme I (PtsI)